MEGDNRSIREPPRRVLWPNRTKGAPHRFACPSVRTGCPGEPEYPPNAAVLESRLDSAFFNEKASIRLSLPDGMQHQGLVEECENLVRRNADLVATEDRSQLWPVAAVQTGDGPGLVVGILRLADHPA